MSEFTIIASDGRVLLLVANDAQAQAVVNDIETMLDGSFALPADHNVFSAYLSGWLADLPTSMPNALAAMWSNGGLFSVTPSSGSPALPQPRFITQSSSDNSTKAATTAYADAVGTGKQPLDATLTALAALTTAANKVIYATGSDTFATADLTAYGRSLIGGANAAAVKTLLSLAVADITGAAPLASPTFTGTPAGPTASLGTNTTQFATTAFVAGAVAALINSAPGALDTLKELADAMGDDANFAASTATSLAGKQPLDATLTALAALTTAADKIIYATGADTFATADFTSFARTLVAVANAGAARTALGLVIGTDVQAQDATLAALAAITTAANKLIYATGVDTFATTDFTAFGRTLAALADAAAARTALALSSADDVSFNKVTAAAASGFFLGSHAALQQSGNYTFLFDNEGAGFVQAGNSADKTTYVNNDALAVRNRATSTTYLAIGAAVAAFSVPVGLPSFTVATVPTATAARLIYVSDESGGATPAFSDGTNWRRVADRTIVS